MQGVLVHAGLALAGEVERGFGGGRAVGLVDLQHARGFLQLLDLARQRRLLARALLVAAHRVADFGEVARARRRHDRRLVGAVAHGDDAAGGRPCSARPSSARRGFSAWYSAVTPSSLKRAAMVPNTGISSGFLPQASLLRWTCLATSRSASSGALAVELVDRHELGEVQHVDLLELAGGAEFRRHHVHRDVDQRHDRGVALADAGGFDDDQVEAGGLAGGDDVGQGGGDLAAEVARGQRAHEDARALLWLQGPIAFMRMRSPSRAPPLLRRDGSIEITATRRLSSWSRRSRRISSSVREDLPAPPVPVMPSTGIVRACASALIAAMSLASALPFSSAVMSWASARQFISPWPWMALQVLGRVGGEVLVAAHHHLADHSRQAHALAVLGAVDARHAVGLQLADLRRHDHAAAAAEHLDVLAAART